jgi:hypothetical protein
MERLSFHGGTTPSPLKRPTRSDASRTREGTAYVPLPHQGGLPTASPEKRRSSDNRNNPAVEDRVETHGTMRPSRHPVVLPAHHEAPTDIGNNPSEEEARLVNNRATETAATAEVHVTQNQVTCGSHRDLLNPAKMDTHVQEIALMIATELVPPRAGGWRLADMLVDTAGEYPFYLMDMSGFLEGDGITVEQRGYLPPQFHTPHQFCNFRWCQEENRILSDRDKSSRRAVEGRMIFDHKCECGNVMHEVCQNRRSTDQHFYVCGWCAH